ncbi:MAG: DUF1036 domain-containing protein [Alphaproteobacteria bacterium]|nr:DUF1036 domain-containing protein [Alphaproteobacteria bacterium]
MSQVVSRITVWTRAVLTLAVLCASGYGVGIEAASAQPKPPGGTGTGAGTPAAGTVQVPEGQFAGPTKDGKANGKGRLTLRNGLVVEDAEYQDGVQLGLVFCNSGDAAVFGALAWREGDDWTSKGWYRVDAKKCMTPWTGRIDRRYVAYRLDLSGQAVVGGDFFFCVHPSDGFENAKNTATCPAGTARRGFALADFGEGAGRRGGVIIDTSGAAVSAGATPPAPTTGTLELADATYTGAIRDGKANGRGVMAYKDGARLEGEFVDGVANGPGVWLDKNKNKWSGNFKDGLLFGKVRIDWNDGTVFESADMEQGRIHGLAVCNPRPSVVFGAVGYKEGEAWMAKGWYRIDPNQCVYLRTGKLEQRYWYYRLIAGGAEVKGGEHLFCLHPENAFEMKDADQCPASGVRAGFTQVDLGEGNAKKIGYVTDAPK